VEENIDIQTEIRSLSKIVRDPDLYTASMDTSELEAVTNEQKQIKLYNKEGMVLYTTVREAPILPMLNQIYSNLYDVQENLHSFTYKEPVFEQGELVGIFEIKVDRKSTRLNSSHVSISYAVCSLKKKEQMNRPLHAT